MTSRLLFLSQANGEPLVVVMVVGLVVNSQPIPIQFDG